MDTIDRILFTIGFMILIFGQILTINELEQLAHLYNTLAHQEEPDGRG